MKGIMTFYMNVEEVEGGKEQDYLNLMKQTNADLIAKLESEGYGVMIVPVEKESSRVEKIDFDMPFPRYILPHVDIVEHDNVLQDIKDKAVKDADSEG